MESREQIVRRIAQEAIVEELAGKITHSQLTPDLKDLCQLVYVALLEYDEGKLRDLWEKGEIRFFLARVIMNQLSAKSAYYRCIGKYKRKAVDIAGKDFIDE